MKRLLSSVLAMSSVLALAIAAQAGDHHSQGYTGNQGKQQNQFHFGSWGGISRLVSDLKQHHGHKQEPTKNPIPIDPGRGDGRIPTDPAPVAPPPARPGFVWVKDHWERERAPKTVNPYPADVVVRDHRTLAGKAGGGVIIRDHRTTTENASGGTIIRDHRTATDWVPAGTTVRDHRTSTANGSDASGGTTVIVTNPGPGNDGPVIRDHRTTPVIRDHRTSGK